MPVVFKGRLQNSGTQECNILASDKNDRMYQEAVKIIAEPGENSVNRNYDNYIGIFKGKQT